jgi:hypothetical protein
MAPYVLLRVARGTDRHLPDMVMFIPTCRVYRMKMA